MKAFIHTLLCMTVCIASGPGRTAAEETKDQLQKSLTLHASFDQGLDADFSKGDKRCYSQRGQELIPAEPTAEVRLVPEGKFGKGVHFTKKNHFLPAFKNEGILNYSEKNWNATVSVWLRLNPDEDLEPGYCDPVQIVGNDFNKGFIFLEWSKDHTPRHFRYAIRPLSSIWNPENRGWEEIPAEKRPMVQVERAPFSGDKWTHAVFTLKNLNDESKAPRGELFLNGESQGSIEKWDLTLDWDPKRVLLVLGASYIGHLDDLAVFDRPLNAKEVKTLYELKQGVAELR